MAVFNQTNTKAIIKEALGTKKSQGRAIDEKQYTAMTNMTMCYTIKKQQSTIDYIYDLDQIKDMGVTISNGYIWKSESIKKEIGYYKVKMNCGYQSRIGKTIQK